MKGRKEDVAEWVVAKATELHEIALRVHKAYPLDPKIDEFKANPWTILKLFVLLHYVPVYTSIIRDRYDKMVYIDLFSGSGLLAYKNTEVPVAGSPIVTLYVALEPFDHAFLNDLSKKKRELLSKRINYLKEHNLINVYNISCTQGDANSIIYEILENLIGKKVHGLIFIDPSGLEFRWASLEALLKVRLRFDIIMLYQSYSVAMQALSRIRREREGVKAEALHVFIGDKDWLSYLKEQGGKELSRVEIERLMLEYYTDKIKRILRKHGFDDVVIPINIKLEGLPEASYSILFICKHLGGFVNAMEYIKERIENAPENIIDITMKALQQGERAPGLLKYSREFIERVDELKITHKFKKLRKKGKTIPLNKFKKS